LTGKAFFPSEASRLFQRFNTLKRFQYFLIFGLSLIIINGKIDVEKGKTTEKGKPIDC
jgi:hypothetical protein